MADVYVTNKKGVRVKKGSADDDTKKGRRGKRAPRMSMKSLTAALPAVGLGVVAGGVSVGLSSLLISRVGFLRDVATTTGKTALVTLPVSMGLTGLALVAVNKVAPRMVTPARAGAALVGTGVIAVAPAVMEFIVDGVVGAVDKVLPAPSGRRALPRPSGAWMAQSARLNTGGALPPPSGAWGTSRVNNGVRTGGALPPGRANWE